MREAEFLGLADRLTRGLLRLYPRDFRATLAEDLRLCVRDALRERLRRAGPPRALGFLLGAALDLARAGLAERRGAWRGAFGRRPLGLRLAAGGALGGGLAWLAMVNALALRHVPAAAGMVALALAALGFGVSCVGLARLHGAELSTRGRVGLGSALLGTLPPVALALLRATGHRVPFADYMDAMWFLQLGLLLLGASNLRGGPLRGVVAWSMLTLGLASFWVGVGERHGFPAPAMLIPLALFGALWIVIALALWLRPEPAAGWPGTGDSRPGTA